MTSLSISTTAPELIIYLEYTLYSLPLPSLSHSYSTVSRPIWSVFILYPSRGALGHWFSVVQIILSRSPPSTLLETQCLLEVFSQICNTHGMPSISHFSFPLHLRFRYEVVINLWSFRKPFVLINSSTVLSRSLATGSNRSSPSIEIINALSKF